MCRDIAVKILGLLLFFVGLGLLFQPHPENSFFPCVIYFIVTVTMLRWPIFSTIKSFDFSECL
jgi:hypothetical protein